MKLYSAQLSGNCYKIRLLFAQLGLDYELEEVSVIDRSNRPELLGALNPALRVPTLVLDDGRSLAESPAILQYFAEGTPLLPEDKFTRAQVAQWLSFEQYEIEARIGLARFLLEISPVDPPSMGFVKYLQQGGQTGLEAMENHLDNGRTWFVDDTYTIADIALYGYSHVAPGAGIDLEPYPNVRAWQQRFTEQPGHIGMMD